MRRCTWIMVGLLALVMEARSDVVVEYAGTVDLVNTNNLMENSAGVTFTTTGSTAGSGRWALTNFKFNVFSSGGAFTLTGATVSLFRDLTNSGNYTYVDRQSLTQLAYNISGSTPVEVNLALSSFGTVGNESSGLVAGGRYLLTVDKITSDGDGASGVFGANTALSTGPWAAAGVASYHGTVVNGDTGNLEFPIAGDVTGVQLGLNPFTDNFYTQITAVAVPEPGTLILGGIAAMSGGAGAWWRRRKNRKSTAEQAV